MPALDILDNIVPISDFNRGKATTAFGKVGHDKPVIVMKRNAPSFVIVTPDDYRKAKEAEENYALLCLALERMRDFDPSQTVSREESMAKFGITQADLDAMNEVEFE